MTEKEIYKKAEEFSYWSIDGDGHIEYIFDQTGIEQFVENILETYKDSLKIN